MNFIIFDLDDTLLCGDCEKYWTNFLIEKGFQKKSNSLIALNKFDEDYRNGVLNFEEYSTFILEPLKGLTKSEVDILLKEFLNNKIDVLTDNLTNSLLLEAEKADAVLIASGSHDFLVKCFADHFQINSSIGTPVEVKNNSYTGMLSGEATFYKGKERAVKKWCYENNLKISEAIFYSDSINDMPMFESCGKPVVVNPDRQLLEIANDRSYDIIMRES
tara:strand:- start:1569 stop:2222 length:654 start_codon:yes stop_codon:yes gene_type:complete